MLDTFKARLKAQLKDFKAQNLTQKRIDAYADRLHKKFPELTEEADHDQAIADLNELVSFEEIAKGDDRIRSLETKSKAKPKPKPTEEEPEDEDEADVDEPKWVKKHLQPLMQEIQSLKAEKAQDTIRKKITSHEKAKDIPENYYKRWKMPESEDGVEAFVDELATEYNAFHQDQVSKGLALQQKPAGGSGGGDNRAKPSQAELKELEQKFK